MVHSPRLSIGHCDDMAAFERSRNEIRFFVLSEFLKLGNKNKHQRCFVHFERAGKIGKIDFKVST